MEDREVVICMIENDQGEVLLQKKTMDYEKGPGVWAFFGGETESKDLEKEILRELEEEVGFKLPVEFLFKMSGEFLLHVFQGKLNDLSKISLGEGAGFAFFAKDELEDLKLTKLMRIILDKYFEIKQND